MCAYEKKKRGEKHDSGLGRFISRLSYSSLYAPSQINILLRDSFPPRSSPCFGLDLLDLVTGNHTVDNITWHLHAWARKVCSVNSVIYILLATPVRSVIHVRGSSACILSGTSLRTEMNSGISASFLYPFSGTLEQEGACRICYVFFYSFPFKASLEGERWHIQNKDCAQWGKSKESS